jgi:hypothetical protein
MGPDRDDPSESDLPVNWAAQWLKEAMQAKGWEVPRLALETINQTGFKPVSVRAIYIILKGEGKRSPHRATLEALAHVLETPVPSAPPTATLHTASRRSLSYATRDYMDGLLTSSIQYTRGPRSLAKHTVRHLLLPSPEMEFSPDELMRIYGNDDEWLTWFRTEDERRNVIRSLILAPVASEEDTADEQLLYRLVLRIAHRLADKQEMRHEANYAIWSQLHGHFRKSIEAGESSAWGRIRMLLGQLRSSDDPLWTFGAQVIENKLVVWLDAERSDSAQFGLKYVVPPFGEKASTELLRYRRPEWGYTILLEHMLCHAYDAHAHRLWLTRSSLRGTPGPIADIQKCIDEASQLQEGFTPAIWWNLRFWYAQAHLSSENRTERNRGEIYRAGLEQFANWHNWNWKRRRAARRATGKWV